MGMESMTVIHYILLGLTVFNVTAAGLTVILGLGKDVQLRVRNLLLSGIAYSLVSIAISLIQG